MSADAEEPMDPTLRAHLVERLSHRADRLAKVARMAPSLDAVIAGAAWQVARTAMVLLGETFARELWGHIFDDLSEGMGVCRFCHVRPLRADRTMCQVCWETAASDDDAERGSEMTTIDTATICAVCDSELRVSRWTDTHGIAVCGRCGVPYRMYHYDANHQRVEKPPDVAIRADWLPLGREYWQETRRRVFPGSHDLRCRHGRTYSGASAEDINAFHAWLDARKARWPKTAASERAES